MRARPGTVTELPAHRASPASLCLRRARPSSHYHFWRLSAAVTGPLRGSCLAPRLSWRHWAGLTRSYSEPGGLWPHVDRQSENRPGPVFAFLISSRSAAPTGLDCYEPDSVALER